MNPEEIQELRRRYLGPSLSLSYREPLTIVRGQGAYLYDHQDRAYLECVNNVAHVGHCHPRVIAAGHRQMELLNTNTRYLHPNVVRYAEQLLERLPDPLEVCYFVNSGSEANELAWRMARAVTGGTGAVVLDVAYHGNTNTCIDLSPYKFNGPGGSGRPDHVRVVDLPYPYRGRYREDVPDLGRRYADQMPRALTELEDSGHRPAAFFAESLPSCGGQIDLPEGFLEAAYGHVHAAGGVAVADEVQVGFGRVGSRFWGFEIQGVVPDIVTLGKPIGNGHPLGAVITTRAVAEAFANGMEYFNTFGGNPVSCAIGLAVLEVVEEEDLQANALRVGERLKAGLTALMDRHPAIGEVRGRGLFLGIEFVADRGRRDPDARTAAEVVERMKERGFLLSTDGADHNVIKIKPPLVITSGDGDRLVDVLDQELDRLD